MRIKPKCVGWLLWKIGLAHKIAEDFKFKFLTMTEKKVKPLQIHVHTNDVKYYYVWR